MLLEDQKRYDEAADVLAAHEAKLPKAHPEELVRAMQERIAGLRSKVKPAR